MGPGGVMASGTLVSVMVHKTACAAPFTPEPPTTCPALLMPRAALPDPPGRAPRPIMVPVVPFWTSGVHRKAAPLKRSQKVVDDEMKEQPTTCPRSLMPKARLADPPGKLPRS